jgi:hypothetical protein
LITAIVQQGCDFGLISLVVHLLRLTDPPAEVFPFLNSFVGSGLCEALQLRQIPLESNMPVLQVSSVPWPMKKNQFTIDMMMRYDDIASLRVPAIITVWELTDGVSSLKMIFQNAVMWVTYTLRETVTTRILCRNVNFSDWTRFTLIMSVVNAQPNPRTQAATFVNGDATQNITLDCVVDFDSRSLVFSIGGSNLPAEGHMRYIILKDIRFYPFYLQEVQGETKAPQSLPAVTDSLFALELPETYTRLGGYHRLSTIIDILAATEMAGRIAETCSSQMFQHAITVLTFIFDHRPDLQYQFQAVHVLQRKFMDRGGDLTYDLYESTFRVLNAIEDERLLTQWIEKLVFNPWIWEHAKDAIFAQIISHWERVLLVRFINFFLKRSYFSPLLTQYSILFTATRSQTDSRDRSSSEKNFLNFVLSVSKVNFTEEDFETLFSFALQSDDLHLSAAFIRLLHAVSAHSVTLKCMQRTHFTILHRTFFCGDLSLITLLILTVHNLSGDDVIPHMVICAYEVMGRPGRSEIFESILSELHNYPTTIVFLAILAADMGKDAAMRVAQAAMALENPTIRKFVAHPEWYIFVILLLYNLPPESLDCFCFFIAKCLAFADDDCTPFGRMLCIMIRLTIFRPSHEPIPFLIRFLRGFIQSDDRLLASAVIRFCYWLFFFRLQIESHSPALLTAYANSPYVPPDFACRLLSTPAPEDPPLLLPKLEAFVEDQFHAFTIFCQVRLDEIGGLRDLLFANVATQLSAIFQVDDIAPEIPKTLAYYMDRAQSENVQAVDGLITALGRECDSFSQTVVASLEHFRMDLLSTMERVRQLLNHTHEMADQRPLTHRMLLKISEEMTRSHVDTTPTARPPMKPQNLF